MTSPVSSMDLVSQKRIEMARRYAATSQQRRASGTSSSASGSERLCWLCSRDTAAVVYDRRDLCLDCAEEVLRYILMPLLEQPLTDVDASVESMIQAAEASGLGMTPSNSNHVGSPLGSELVSPNYSGWTCFHCKSIQSDAVPRCLCCRKPRPAEPICPRCDKNALKHSACSTTGKPHVRWACTSCHADNIDDAVECRVCRHHRTWFCAACSLENSWAHKYCDACGGDHKEELSSLVNREFLQQLGLTHSSVNLHRDQQKKVEQAVEHTARLERRIDQLGLLPIPIDDDGNCLFRAISFQLVRTDVFHSVVRHLIMDYMEDRRTEYALLVGGDDFDGYVSGMRRNSVWGDELCVHAAARAFQCKIHVITSDDSRWHLKYDCQAVASFSTPNVTRQLFLCYRSPDHYFCAVHPQREPKVRTIDLEASFKAWLPAAAAVVATSSSPAATSSGTHQPSGTPPQGVGSSSSAAAAYSSGSALPAAASSQRPTQVQPPPPPPPSSSGHVSVRLTASSDSPPPHRRGGPAPVIPQKLSNNSAGGVAATHLPQHPAPPQQQLHAQPGTLVGNGVGGGSQLPKSSHSSSAVSSPAGGPAREPPPPPPPMQHHHSAPLSAATAPAEEPQRPMTRSLRNEVLQFRHFGLLPHPIMIRLCVASSNLNIGVNAQEHVVQDREGAYFYLYNIRYQMILDGGPTRYPWGALYHQVEALCRRARDEKQELMPLFLLQHIRTGGFVRPGEDLSLRIVFADMDPVHCADVRCQRTNDLTNCILTVEDQYTQSRSKLYLRFLRKELKCPYVGFIGDRPLFCCELPVGNAMLVVHQLFSGNAERLCLRCNQWYTDSRRPKWFSGDARQPGGAGACSHFSWVDETLEEIDRY